MAVILTTAIFEDYTYEANYAGSGSTISITRKKAILGVPTLDSTFGTAGIFNLTIYGTPIPDELSISIVIDSQNQALVSTKNLGEDSINVARITNAGILDTSFGTAGYFSVEAPVGFPIPTPVGVTSDDLQLSFGSLTASIGITTAPFSYSSTSILGTGEANLTLTGGDNVDGTGNILANIITGNSGKNILSGGAGADKLYGGAGNDTLNGGADDDTLHGGAGSDTMSGGIGSDTYYVDSISDKAIEDASAGIDTVVSSVSYALGANVEHLTLTGIAALKGTGNALDNIINGNNGNNTLSGGAGFDRLYGLNGDDILDGGTGFDDMYGGAGNDTYIVDNPGDFVLGELATVGEIDTVKSSISYTLDTNVENLTLTGTAIINGTGNASANTIIGNSAANIIDGGTGADAMSGGGGNDTFTVDDSGDTVTELAGGGTQDTVNSLVDFTLLANVENLTLTVLSGTATTGTGNASANTITANNLGNTLNGFGGNDILNGGDGIDTLNGGDGNDTLNGNLGVDALNGGAGADKLNGGAGADALNGDAGTDIMTGGADNDTYVVDITSDVIVELLGGGVDSVTSTANYTLSSEVENLTLTGAAKIGIGNVLANIIVGNNNGNTLNGGGGSDTITGGTGKDIINGGLGIDTLNGGDNDDTINGGLDNDTLNGGAGIDTLDGGVGADAMNGGAGNDTYVVDNALDTITESATVGEIDTVKSSISYTLTNAEVENLTLTGTESINGTGNSGVNTLTGNSGRNTLSGGAGADSLNGGLGADTMIGGEGNDTYTVDNTLDVVTEAATVGETDTVTATVNYTLGANIENLILSTGFANLNGTGSSDANTITGNSGNNTLKGEGGADILNGGAGKDILNGGAGDDSLNGGDGDDTYVFKTDVNEGTDTINETSTPTSGTDTLKFFGTAGVTIDLGSTASQVVVTDVTGTAAVEGLSLVLTAITLDNVTGGDGNDIITGNGFDNILIGAKGSDTLNGGGGNDTLTGGAGNDFFVFSSFLSAGIDNITDFKVGEDKIRLSATAFGLSTAVNSPLSSITFKTVTTDALAETSSGAIVYNSSNGKLFFNQDIALNAGTFGTGGQFAQLTAGLGLTSGDFIAI